MDHLLHMLTPLRPMGIGILITTDPGTIPATGTEAITDPDIIPVTGTAVITGPEITVTMGIDGKEKTLLR